MITSIAQVERHARQAAERCDFVPAYQHPAGPKADATWAADMVRKVTRPVEQPEVVV